MAESKFCSLLTDEHLGFTVKFQKRLTLSRTSTLSNWTELCNERV